MERHDSIRKYFAVRTEITHKMSSGGRFIDRKKITLKAGNGGKGAATFVHSRDLRGGPDGGDGGNGGSIHFVADTNVSHLGHLKHHYTAMSGGAGAGKNRFGKNAQDLLLKIPVGTVIRDCADGSLLFDVTTKDQIVTVARGGKKGLGNVHFKSPTNVRPQELTGGGVGETKTIELEMKLIANIALIGFPNAGKSSLLASVSRATPKIANYPFTTLKPNIGVMNLTEDCSVSIADIPGLIEGAHQNIGLGHYFLRHVERCRTFLYVMDISVPDVLGQFEILKREMEFYQKGLTSRPSIFVANKCDLVENHNTLINQLQSSIGIPVVLISAKHKQNISELRLALLHLHKTKEDQETEKDEEIDEETGLGEIVH